MQFAFARDLLAEARRRGLHTVVETAGLRPVDGDRRTDPAGRPLAVGP